MYEIKNLLFLFIVFVLQIAITSIVIVYFISFCRGWCESKNDHNNIFNYTEDEIDDNFNKKYIISTLILLFIVDVLYITYVWLQYKESFLVISYIGIMDIVVTDAIVSSILLLMIRVILLINED